MTSRSIINRHLATVYRPLTIDGAPGNIQDNLTDMLWAWEVGPHPVEALCILWWVPLLSVPQRRPCSCGSWPRGDDDCMWSTANSHHISSGEVSQLRRRTLLTRTHARTHTHTNLYIYIHIHIQIQIHIHIHIHIYINIHISLCVLSYFIVYVYVHAFVGDQRSFEMRANVLLFTLSDFK